MKFTSIVFLSLYLLSATAFSKTHKVVLLGQSGIGKTTLLNAIFNSAIHAKTPINHPDTIKFIKPIDEGRTSQIPAQTTQHRYISHVEQTTYANIAFADTKTVAESDTSNLVGYRFTPKFAGWPQGDDLEIIDTPGIDDTRSKPFDNQSAHIQIIQQLEQQLHQHGQDISAIFLVVSNLNVRNTNNVRITLEAIREALPPKINDRFFVLVNRSGLRNSINPRIQSIVDTAFAQPDKTKLNYIKVDPEYIANFNEYLNDELSPTFAQVDRESTDNNLRHALAQISQLPAASVFQEHANFIQDKHKLALEINQLVQPTLDIESNENTLADALKAEKKLQEKYYSVLNKLQTMYIAGDTFNISASCLISGASATFIGLLSYAANRFTYRKERYTLNEKIAALKAAIQADKQRVAQQTTAAESMFAQMQTRDYTLVKNTSQAEFAQALQKRIEVHFPETYKDQSLKEKIDDIIKNTFNSIPKSQLS